MTLYVGTTRAAENNDWSGTTALTTAFAQAGAFSLRSDSRDAALIATLAPGNHSVQVSNANGSTGLSLVEVYEMP